MQSKIGEIYDGKVTGIQPFGAFVKMTNGESGMVHISEVANNYIKDIKEHLAEGQDVKVKVIGVNEQNKISLSIKQALPKEEKHDEPAFRPKTNSAPRKARFTPAPAKSAGPMSFEDMMTKFKQESDEKISVLNRNAGGKTGSRRGGRGGK